MANSIPKSKTTFDVDSQDLHLDFKNATNRQGSDMTKELNKFMRKYVEEFNASERGKEGGNL